VKPRSRLHPYLMVLPTVAILTVFFVVPLLRAVELSFTHWDLLTPPRPAGLSNYERIVASGQLGRLLTRTFTFGVLVVVGSTSLGLGLALALQREGRVYAFVRGAVFSAYVVSWVAVALLWMWLLDGDAGLVTRALVAVGLPQIRWLGDPDTALYAIAFVTIWKISGYSMVIYLSGLASIPPSLYEAAALDGAGRTRQFLHVTWPALRPTTAFVATTGLIMSFQAFDVIRVMTQGGPVESTTLFVYAIYEEIFQNLRVGRASALIVVFFVFLMGLTLLNLAALRRSDPRGAR
jgi:ABC-type sugar transport system permease subunit